MAELRMPKLSDVMESGFIERWLVDDGATVSANDDVVEIETDKAIVTHQANASGVLTIVAEVEQEVSVGEVIATINEPEE